MKFMRRTNWQASWQRPSKFTDASGVIVPGNGENPAGPCGLCRGQVSGCKLCTGWISGCRLFMGYRTPAFQKEVGFRH